ncbi:hypothetical protein PVMG_04596 [Plasmodium vivax Mauritania I]|uniref:PIR Superfamily Protein n=1 Tax=Plasmodium vivax Mauritania I TaxID=1035515 RepID=A0A0J9T425_PLAVI|nr:hypothetical protein PVMG_04596 [Plasmodium vivax Mauritania I]
MKSLINKNIKNKETNILNSYSQNNIWNLYKEFYEPVNGDASIQTYEDLCEEVLVESAENHRKHKNFCKKLIRNLYSPSNYRENGKLKSERCRNLTNWLYYMIIKYDIPDDLISKCFQKTESKMKEQGKHICPYSPYKEIHQEPEAMLKINNFEGIMDVVKSKLMDSDHSKNCSCEDYVYECVRMYNYMNSKYCNTTDRKDRIYKDTCSQLRAFYNTYNSYYSQNTQLNGKIPPISKADTQYHFKCSTGASQFLSEEVEDDRTESSILLSVPSVLGTVAGISSILALSYKVNIY